MQPLHPQASEAQLLQQVQSQQLAEKLQHKLQGDSAGTETAFAADSQLQTDAQADRRHHKMAHAHFADDADDDSITGRNESITAVRGGEAGSSQAEGSFWKRLDANGSFTSESGAALQISGICNACIRIHIGMQTTVQFASTVQMQQKACIASAAGSVSILTQSACDCLQISKCALSTDSDQLHLLQTCVQRAVNTAGAAGRAFHLLHLTREADVVLKGTTIHT